MLGIGASMRMVNESAEMKSRVIVTSLPKLDAAKWWLYAPVGPAHVATASRRVMSMAGARLPPHSSWTRSRALTIVPPGSGKAGSANTTAASIKHSPRTFSVSPRSQELQ